MISAGILEGKREELKLRRKQIAKKFCQASYRSRFRGSRSITARSIGRKRIAHILSEANKVDVFIEQATRQKRGRTVNRISKTESAIRSFPRQYHDTQNLRGAVGRPAKQIQATVAQITGTILEDRESTIRTVPSPKSLSPETPHRIGHENDSDHYDVIHVR
jgi:hypothetical protein